MTVRVHFLIAAAVAACTLSSPAQEITATLPGSTASQGFTVYAKGGVKNLFTTRGNGRVGIGTATPAFKLTLFDEGGILAVGDYNSGPQLPNTGNGPRFIWYPRKSAFRAGYTGGTEWQDRNIGERSTALGSSTEASGDFSTALGVETTASGYGATAMGFQTTASSQWSTAIGDRTTASGERTTAMGFESTASASDAIAIGHNATASGVRSVAMGSSCTASGIEATAIGGNTTASGNHAFSAGYHTTASGVSSTAMGSRVSTNGKSGCFMIGDGGTTTMMNSTYSNRFYARFDNGYILYTKADRTTAMYAFGGATSWSSASDSTLKEHFHSVIGERFLRSFRTLRLGSWNYIGDDQRHYGPMAQEWFSAFGHDGIGTIGNDTTLASADVDGVLCIAVQALEKRTSENMDEIASVQESVDALRKQLEMKDAEIARLRNEIASLHRDNARRDAKYRELLGLVRNLQRQQETSPQHAQFIGLEAGQ